MGTEQANGRRALVQGVKDCISLVNECNGAVAEAQKRHNALATQTGTDVGDITTRLDGQGKWIGQVEASATTESRRLTQTRVELGQVGLEQSAFAGLTFLQRWRWLLTGYWPKPLTFQESTATQAPASPSLAPEKATRVDVDESTLSYGRMSAGMAPRPLP